jgi:hypothetical protein
LVLEWLFLLIEVHNYKGDVTCAVLVDDFKGVFVLLPVEIVSQQDDESVVREEKVCLPAIPEIR